MNADPKLSEIGQIAITVSDVKTALAFYRDVLGLTCLFRVGSNLAFLLAGSVRVMPSHALWIGFLRDPDSNLVALMEEKR